VLAVPGYAQNVFPKYSDALTASTVPLNQSAAVEDNSIRSSHPYQCSEGGSHPRKQYRIEALLVGLTGWMLGRNASSVALIAHLFGCNSRSAWHMDS
jgi:hypothetical protein